MEGSAESEPLTHDQRMLRDPDLLKRTAMFQSEIESARQQRDSDPWAHEELVERPHTRSQGRIGGGVADVDADASMAAEDVDSGDEGINVEHILAAVGVSMPSTSNSVKKALSGSDSEDWQRAREKELEGISTRNTWTKIKGKPPKKAITSKWHSEYRYSRTVV